MDDKIREAIESAVREAGQTKDLANKIHLWFQALASANEQINDRQSTEPRLELLYEEAAVE